MKATQLYGTWWMMKSRCSNPKQAGYQYYGARGIRVCERWNSFANFVADVGDRPPGTSLDRIDNNGNYEPGNVRWATAIEQSRNSSKKRRDLTGGTFAGLTVMALAFRRKNGVAHWHCVCSCGAKTVKRGDKILSGRTRSCGCKWGFR